MRTAWGEVLFGHQHGELVVLLELLDGVDGAGDQERRQPDRGLVHQQDARRQHERAGERQHLLLAAAHGAGATVSPALTLIETSWITRTAP